MIRWLLLFSLIVLTEVTESRVFDMRNETGGAYFIGSAGPSYVGQSLIHNTGTADAYDQSVMWNHSGEFGFFYTGHRAGIRIGFEAIIPEPIRGVQGKSGENVMFVVGSTGFIYVPKIGADLNLMFGPTYRWLLSGAVGSATGDFTNNFTEVTTSEGDHVVEFTGKGILWSATTGIEYYLMDTTTVLFEAGYRSLTIDEYTYKKSVATFVGNVNSGDIVKDNERAPRFSIFSGMIFNLGFRIYF